MGNYHDKAIDVERALTKLNPYRCPLFKADSIDIHPTAAYTYFFGSLIDENYRKNGLENHELTIRMSRIIDEICCIIGNNELDTPFEYDGYRDEWILQGQTNEEIIDEIYAEMIKSYNNIHHTNFHYLW